MGGIKTKAAANSIIILLITVLTPLLGNSAQL
jgi:hypothetical protein